MLDLATCATEVENLAARLIQESGLALDRMIVVGGTIQHGRGRLPFWLMCATRTSTPARNNVNTGENTRDKS